MLFTEVDENSYLVEAHKLYLGKLKKGKFENKPFVRIRYQALGSEQLIFQLLPWVPGWPIFEDNFKRLAGMSYPEMQEKFKTSLITENKDKFNYFASLIQDNYYKVSVIENGSYLNVSNILQRISKEEYNNKYNKNNTDNNLDSKQEDNNQSNNENQELESKETDSNLSPKDKVLKELKDIIIKLGYQEDHLETIAVEEFANPIDKLEEMDLIHLKAFLEEELEAKALEN